MINSQQWQVIPNLSSSKYDGTPLEIGVSPRDIQIMSHTNKNYSHLEGGGVMMLAMYFVTL